MALRGLQRETEERILGSWLVEVSILQHYGALLLPRVTPEINM